MQPTCNYLFVYGTLLDEQNEFGAYLRQTCSLVGSGQLKGMLFDAGEYPAAIYHPEGDANVSGKIFLIGSQDILTKIDIYEGFGAAQSFPNEFIRALAPVELGNQVLTCWVYLYNMPVTSLKRIPGGDYISYLKM